MLIDPNPFGKLRTSSELSTTRRAKKATWRVLGGRLEGTSRERMKSMKPLLVKELQSKWHQLGGFLKKAYIEAVMSDEFRVMSKKLIKDKRLEKSYTVTTPPFPLTATGCVTTGEINER